MTDAAIIAARLAFDSRLGRQYGPRVYDAQAVLCEDDRTVMFYITFEGGDETIFSYDLPGPVDPVKFDYRTAANLFLCATPEHAGAFLAARFATELRQRVSNGEPGRV
jgi:hypothetical protein